MKAPIVANYGAGVDSTAKLIGCEALGIRPDLVLFADTGGEKPETYAYLPVFNAWLRRVGFPEVTVVKYRPSHDRYDTLESNCTANETLPSIAFRGGGPGSGGCSLKFKAEVMNAWLIGKKRGPWKGAGWEPFHKARDAGVKTVRLIGYDDSVADRKRTVKAAGRIDPHFEFRYLLQEWHWDRDRCKEAILAAGLPLPPKSACFFCPASKKPEIIALADEHPDLFMRAVAMEDRAADGKHGLGEKRGLGINFRWRAFAEKQGFLVGDVVDGERARALRVLQ